MRDFAAWLEKAAPNPKNAFEAHYRLVRIHPFSDSNGRTARLLMNLLLLRGGYPPVAIGPEHRVAYIEALERRHMTGDAAPYEALLAERIDESLTRYLDTIEKKLEARRSEPPAGVSSPGRL